MTVEIPSRYPPLTRPATAYPSLPGGSLLVSALAQYSMSADKGFQGRLVAKRAAIGRQQLQQRVVQVVAVF
jgi:hypothetical protein